MDGLHNEKEHSGMVYIMIMTKNFYIINMAKHGWFVL